MMIIGLTGGIGSGKSTVATMLQNAAIPIIDADELARRVVSADSLSFKAIVEAFGKTILKDDQTIDRTKLAALVFSDELSLRKLEAIIHPRIEELFKLESDQLRERGHSIVVYMAPLLFEKNLQKKCDKTLLVIANAEIRKTRLYQRDQLSPEEAEKRFKFQLSDQEKIKLADEVIENNKDVIKLYKNLSQAWKKLTNTSLPLNH